MKKKIKNELKNNDILHLLDDLLKQFNLRCVEIDVKRVSGELRIAIFLTKCDCSAITSDDLDIAYGNLYPFFEERNKDLNYSLELSTPGIDRTIKDVHEFFVFEGREIKVLACSSSEWISGKIVKATDDSVALLVGGCEKTIMIDDIKTAKLIG